MTEEAKEELRKLFRDNGLSKDDIFSRKLKDKYGVEKEFVIITRTGIDKIELKNNIHTTVYPAHISDDLCVVKAVCEKDGTSVETFSSASTKNCQTSYLMEMAEKRARARGVLRIMKLYAFGVFGEDEHTAFDKNNPDNTIE